MHSKQLQIIGAIVVLAIAMGGGWLVTTQLQRTVPIVPGIQGCWRLEGTARQVSCLSDEFRGGAAEAASGASGVERDQAVITYVRRAERLAASDPRLAGTCHPSMHELGRDQGRLAAKQERTPQFPGGSSQLCTAGYVHGLAEGYLDNSPSADVAAVFPKLCHDEPSRTGCAHGIGHALVRARADTSAAEAGAAAADACEPLPQEFPTNCHDGVYMELAMRTAPKPVSVDDFIATCEGSGTVERELACWGYLVQSLNSNDVPIEKMPEACAQAPLPGQFTCIDAYGRDLGVARVARCSDAARRPALQERCIEGAIGLQVGSGHVSAAEARGACATLSSKRLKDHCGSAVSRYLKGKAKVEAA